MFDIIIRYSVAQWAKGREKENKNRMKVTIKMFHQLRYPAC